MAVHLRHRPLGAQLGEVPRPARAALPYAVLALAACAIALLAPRWWVPALAVAAVLVVAAAFHALRELLALRRIRGSLDRLLALRAPTPDVPLLERRSEELTQAKQRERLAHDLQRILREAERRSLPGASPLNRVAVRRDRAALEALEARLLDLERPVDARGIVLVRALLTDADSPLFEPAREHRLAGLADEARRALEP